MPDKFSEIFPDLIFPISAAAGILGGFSRPGSRGVYTGLDTLKTLSGVESMMHQRQLEKASREYLEGAFAEQMGALEGERRAFQENLAKEDVFETGKFSREGPTLPVSKPDFIEAPPLTDYKQPITDLQPSVIDQAQQHRTFSEAYRGSRFDPLGAETKQTMIGELSQAVPVPTLPTNTETGQVDFTGFNRAVAEATDETAQTPYDREISFVQAAQGLAQVDPRLAAYQSGQFHTMQQAAQNEIHRLWEQASAYAKNSRQQQELDYLLLQAGHKNKAAEIELRNRAELAPRAFVYGGGAGTFDPKTNVMKHVLTTPQTERTPIAAMDLSDLGSAELQERYFEQWNKFTKNIEAEPEQAKQAEQMLQALISAMLQKPDLKPFVEQLIANNGAPPAEAVAEYAGANALADFRKRKGLGGG